MKNKATIALLLTPIVILLIPFLAMQFQIPVMDPGSGLEQVNWSVSDFIVMGILLYGAVFGYLLLSKLTANSAYKTAIGIGIVLLVLWLWAELAVGIFTNWGS